MEVAVARRPAHGSHRGPQPDPADELAMEYIARLLRRTVDHNGPVKRHEIDPWLRRDDVLEFQTLLDAPE
jgi:hypothetical protein